MAATKQQKELLALLGLAVVATLAWQYVFGKGRANAGALSASGQYQPINAVDYSGVLKKRGVAQSTEYKATGRNIFVAGAEPVAAGPGDKPKVAGPPPRLVVGPFLPPEPPPPVLTWKFFGMGALPANGARRAFLLDGEEVHIVAEGDTIQNHIRITHIGNDRIEFEDVNTGKKNSATIEMPPTA